MKKKLFAFTLSFCLAFTMLFPLDVFAANDPQEPEQISSEELDTNDVDELEPADVVEPDLGETTAPEENDGENTEPSKDPEPSRDSEPVQIEEPFMTQSFVDFFDENLLVYPEGMGTTEDSAVKVSKYDAGKGVFFKGSKADVTSGKIQIAANFDFSDGKVGRIKVNGLADRGSKTSVAFYLDDQEEPVATVPLKNQMGKAGWTKSADYTADALGANITGEHSISFSFIDESDASKASILLRSVEFVQSSVPVIWFNIDESQGTIDAMNNDESHDTECYGSMTLQVPDGYEYEYKDKKPFTGEVDLEYIRGRGNSTWSEDKKPYKIKLAKKQNLLGMGKNKHWILLANRFDNSGMRNKMTYWLGDKLGDDGNYLEFTPQSVPVEVVMNGDYYGTYYLTEQIRIGESRIEIDDLEDEDTGGPNVTKPPELTGGYLVSMEPYGDEPTYDYCTMVMNSGVKFFLERPSFEEYQNDVQMGYIREYLQKTENAIFGKDFKDNENKSYEYYMDINAAVDYFWVQELSCNGDAYGSGSTYLFKTRDKVDEDGNLLENGKLYWGPLWDFDYVAWGDLQYNDYDVDSLHYTNTPWFNRLRSDPEFIEKVQRRWPKIMEYMNEITRQGGLLDQYYDQLYIPMKYDREKWGTYEEWETSEDTGKRTYLDEVEQLRDWITQRVDYVDNNLDEIKAGKYNVKFKVGKKVIETRTVIEGEAIGKLPKAPSKAGYYFMGWYVNGDKVTEDWSPYYDMTVKAKYVKKSAAVKPKKIYLNTYSVSCSIEDEQFQMEYTVNPLNAYYSRINWKSSDPSIATVNAEGGVLFKGVGTVTITASIPNGPSAKCKFNIVGDYDDMSWIESYQLNKRSLKLGCGNMTQIRTITDPESVEYTGMIWLSSNENVAEVNSYGVVTAKKPGKAVIIVFCQMTSEVHMCNVTVVKGKNPVVVKGNTVTVKRSTLKKKSKAIKRSKAVDVFYAKGKVTYRKVKGNSKLQINKRSGKVTVGKGLKKGTYKLKVKVKAAGNSRYKKLTKTAIIKIKVK